MGRRAADGGTGLSRRLLLAGALLAVTAGCGGDSRPAIPSDGVILASGPGSPWNLLTVAREGGPARLSSLAPAGSDSSLWSGAASLPGARALHRVGSRHLALLGDDGGVERYDPVRDLVSSVGRTSPDAEWTAYDRWGLFRPPASPSLLQLAPGGAWSYRLERPAVWASPAAGGAVVAILAADGADAGAMVRYERGGSEPAARLAGEFSPPAVVTGFGERVAALRRTGEGEGWELVLVALPELEPVGTVELPGRADALAASPSSHELYVAVGRRLLIVGRSSMEIRSERDLPAAVSTIRPGLLGGPLLVRAGDAVHLLPWDGEARPLDTEWREDVPLSLPDGTVLALRSGSAVRMQPGGGPSRALGPADRWWIPVRWSPPEVEARRRAAAAAVPAQGGPQESGAPAAESGGEESRAAPAGPDPDAGPVAPAAGFYAVVVAARDPAGVERLLARLRADGWPTDIQEWRDDAGRSWHRGLVGPYGTRPEAEEAARRLQRERDLSVWVKELGPGLGGGR